MPARDLVAIVAVALVGCADRDSSQVDSARHPARVLRGSLLSISHSFAPNLTTRADGDSILTALSVTHGGNEFIALNLNDDSIDPTVIADGQAFFANWADVPGLVQAGDGSLLAHWLQQTGIATYDYGVRLARSTDDGETWKRLGWLNDDAWGVGDGETMAGEHGFVSWIPEGNGARAFWLDGRAAAGHGEGHNGSVGAMQLRTTTVVDGEVQPSELLDERVCDCCPTAAVATASGPLVAFRDRSEDEIRDIHILRRTSDGWQRTVIDTSGWQIPGCPVNGPALAAEGDLVLVSWYTAHPEPSIYAAWSQDGGVTFGDSVRLTTDTLGRVSAAVFDGAGHVAWLSAFEATSGDEMPPGEVRLMRVDPDGKLGTLVSVASTTATRQAGIPRLIVDGDRLGLAWTKVVKGPDEIVGTRVAFRRVEVAKHTD